MAITFCILAGIALIKMPAKSAMTSQVPHKIAVTASFYPLAYFAQEIGGDKVSVFNVTPAGSEPHDFEPTPQDLANVFNSKLFIYNGAGLEPWVDKIIPDLQNKKVTLVKASTGVDIIGSGAQTDPHIWLDPVLAQQIGTNIRDGLIAVDPQNSAFYTQNSDNLILKLTALDQQYQKSLSHCQQTDIFTSHQAFAYLAKRYNFKSNSITGLSPNEEPSPQTMADLVNLIKEKKVKYVLTETLVSTKLSDTLAEEAKVTTLVFNPLEGLTPNDLKDGQDYFSIQQQNIKNISTALQCQSL